MDQSELSVCFQLTLPDTLQEGTAYLLGNLYELGAWNISRALKMKNLGANIHYLNTILQKPYPDTWNLEYQYLFISAKNPVIKALDKKSLKMKALYQQTDTKNKVLDDQWVEPQQLLTQTQIVYVNQDDLPEESIPEFRETLSIVKRKVQKQEKVYFKVMVLNEKEYFELFQVNEQAIVFKVPQQGEESTYYYFVECDHFLTGLTSSYQFKELDPEILIFLYFYDNKDHKPQLKLCKKLFIKAFSLKENQVQLQKIKKQCIKVIWEVGEDKEKRLVECQEIQKILSLQRNIQLKQKGILKHLQISGLYFLPDFNKDWKNYTDQYTYRGPKNFRTKYFYPKGWRGYAVDAQNMYDGSKDWLGRDGNEDEWWVAFHGTKEQYVRQIIQEGLKPGGGQAMANSVCKITKRKTGQGVYFGNTIEVAQGYCSVYQFNNKRYMIALQCRVNPKGVKNPGGGGGGLGVFGNPGGGIFGNPPAGGGLFGNPPAGGGLFGNPLGQNINQQQQDNGQDRFQHQRNEIYVVGNPEDIRIYRILIREQ